ncbi:MAG: hypothetical protein ACI381_08060 [Candidatus Methanomethylophilaceae archaeon]
MNQSEVLDIVRTHGPIKSKDISEILGCDDVINVRKKLKMLRTWGLVEPFKAKNKDGRTEILYRAVEL